LSRQTEIETKILSKLIESTHRIISIPLNSKVNRHIGRIYTRPTGVLNLEKGKTIVEYDFITTENRTHQLACYTRNIEDEPSHLRANSSVNYWTSQ
jgi:hypothetical protein